MFHIDLSTRRTSLSTAKLLAALFCSVFIAFGQALHAAADPVDLDDANEMHTTKDGYDVSLTLSDMSVNSVANMAQTPFTREAFVSATASVDIAGKGTVPLDTGLVKLGMQASCQIDLSNGLQLGGQLGLALNLPPGMGDNSGLIVPSIGGQLSFVLKPGQISTVPVAIKQLNGRRGSTTVLNEHLNADACGGPAYVRSYAVVQVSTAEHDEAFTIYGPLAGF